MRKYYNESLVVDKGNINKILEELIAEEINSVDELESFIEKFSEIKNYSCVLFLMLGFP